MEYGTVAEWITAGAAIVGLGSGCLGWIIHRRTMREQHALELYSRCIKLTFEQPQFSSPDWLFSQPGNEWDRLRCTWYQGYLLSTCEEIFLTVGRREDGPWAASITTLVRPHLRPPLELNEFDQDFVKFLEELNPELRRSQRAISSA